MCDHMVEQELQGIETRRNSEFRKALEELINYHSRENGSDTPDFILAEYLFGCLENFDKTLQAREKWYGRNVKMKSWWKIIIGIKGIIKKPGNTFTKRSFSFE